MIWCNGANVSLHVVPCWHLIDHLVVLIGRLNHSSSREIVRVAEDQLVALRSGCNAVIPQAMGEVAQRVNRQAQLQYRRHRLQGGRRNRDLPADDWRGREVARDQLQGDQKRLAIVFADMHWPEPWAALQKYLAHRGLVIERERKRRCGEIRPK